jgi:hypothetical protein
MNRPSTIACLAAGALALLAGCGQGSTKSVARACEGEYVKRLEAAVKVLEDASPGDDINGKMAQALGLPPTQCKDLAPALVHDIVDRVAVEFRPRLDEACGAARRKGVPLAVAEHRDQLVEQVGFAPVREVDGERRVLREAQVVAPTHDVPICPATPSPTP